MNLSTNTDKFIKVGKGEESELPGMNDTLQVLVKATALTAEASHEPDLRRRQNFKSGLKPEYKTLCSDNALVTTLLFGEQLSDQVKDIKETNKITYNVNANPKFSPKFKPVLFTLRKKGFISCSYLDDIFLVGDTFEHCRRNITIHLLSTLGFSINVKKSVTTPTKKLEHLGFIIDSEKMLVYLNKEKKGKN